MSWHMPDMPPVPCVIFFKKTAYVSGPRKLRFRMHMAQGIGSMLSMLEALSSNPPTACPPTLLSMP